jgi:hypothetical protein
VIQLGRGSPTTNFEQFKMDVAHNPQERFAFKLSDPAHDASDPPGPPTPTLTYRTISGPRIKMAEQKDNATLPRIAGNPVVTEPNFAFDGDWLKMGKDGPTATLKGPGLPDVTLDLTWPG